MSGLKHCCKCSFYILTISSACHAASLGFPLSGGVRWSCVLVDLFPLPNRDVQEDVCPEAQGAAERVREAGEEAEGDEGVREIHKAGGEFLVSVCV